MTTPAHHCANLLIQGTTEEVHRALLAQLQEKYAEPVPGPAGLRAMAADLVRLPVREMGTDCEQFSPEVRRGLRAAAAASANLLRVAPLERWKP